MAIIKHKKFSATGLQFFFEKNTWKQLLLSFIFTSLHPDQAAHV